MKRYHRGSAAKVFRIQVFAAKIWRDPPPPTPGGYGISPLVAKTQNFPACGGPVLASF